MRPPSLDRRRFAAMAMSLPLGGLACGTASAIAPPFTASGDGRVRVAVGGMGLLYHLPLTVAQELGFFRAEGLDVSVQDYAGGALALQAVQQGSADVCSGAYDHTLRMQLQGQTYVALMLQGRAPQLAFAASARSWPVRSVQSFKGLRVGVTAPGSSTHLVAQMVLSQNGASLEGISFVGVGASGAGALAALRQGRVHALCHADPVVSVLEQRGEVRLLCDTRTLKGTQDLFGGAMPAASLYAPRTFVQQQPAASQALVHAMVHALKWLQTASAADLMRVVPQDYLLGDRGTYLAAFHKVRDTFSPDGLMPDDGPATALRTLARLRPELAASKVELGRTYTNEYARKAKAKFNA
ncbi:ABC transporter substrate-binding protein [Acidovorax sp. GBBC 3334]|uniref:ABC transporter substrate-binding protein n=1 Tax=unclassified Acidovorax TaxID=2684926 RepID=UPI0023042ED3|nr:MULTISPECIES: ABC transporter substrate-binding protein [unclassified Acidovorax]MDA8456150.1 ABC transporter substrate-binding protein [Acidovorax sp. GBBC 3334]MDA8521206.1 ABC transporter substrate-binding protein [Acidovorax sp. NCPPB 4044]